MRQTLRDYRPVVNNRYHVIESLGSGGMANVYLAYDEVLGREVALKVLRHHFANDEEFVERFRREARISAALSHPNIASVYDLGETQNGSYYMAMEYAPGGTLRDLIRKEGSLAPSKAVGIAIRVAQALEAAHAYGAIHRDIKPKNILLTESQEVKVVDFGIARAATLSEITKEGHVLGTENYMSPEQAKGEPVGPGSDLYSLGVVLYEMLTGTLPHETYGPLLGSATIAKRLSGYPRPPKEINPLIPQKLSAIVVKLLSEDPRSRYSSASSLIANLEQVKGRSLGSTATSLLNSVILKSRALGEVTTRALNSVARQARTTYKHQTRTTRHYRPSAPIPRRKVHKPSWGRPVRGQGQKQKPLPRPLLVVLTLVVVLVMLNLMDPSANARLSAAVERKLENTLRGVEHDIEKALENELDALENKAVDSISGFFTSSPKDREDLNSPSNSPNGPRNTPPDKGQGGSLFPSQNGSLPQSPSSPYNPSPSGTSPPSNSPGGSVSPGMYAPYPNAPPQDSYQQPRQEIERQIDKNLQSLERIFG